MNSLFSLQKPASLSTSLLLDGTNQVKQLVKYKTIWNWRKIFLSLFKFISQRLRWFQKEARSDTVESESYLIVTALSKGANVRGTVVHRQLPSGDRIFFFQFQHICRQLAQQKRDHKETFDKINNTTPGNRWFYVLRQTARPDIEPNYIKFTE